VCIVVCVWIFFSVPCAWRTSIDWGQRDSGPDSSHSSADYIARRRPQSISPVCLCTRVYPGWLSAAGLTIGPLAAAVRVSFRLSPSSSRKQRHGSISKTDKSNTMQSHHTLVHVSRTRTAPPFSLVGGQQRSYMNIAQLAGPIQYFYGLLF
jgi:hypothetical protein